MQSIPRSKSIQPVGLMVATDNGYPVTMSRFGKFCEYVFHHRPIDDGSAETYDEWLMRWQDALANCYFEHTKFMQ